jgi:hypothetical protein
VRIGLLLVALDDLGRPELGAFRAPAGVTASAALPKEIPALVERHTQRFEALSIGVVRLARCLALPELVLFGHHLVYRIVNLRIVQDVLFVSDAHHVASTSPVASTSEDRVEGTVPAWKAERL